ncbi:unnamed protein product [Pedinophyceae sp. YPF-701]|nr:unnamed protein product [Pedinophyceae sp. YPF-701]
MTDMLQPCHLRLRNVRGLVTVLQVLKCSGKHPCVMMVASTGIKVIFEDDAKAMQGWAFFKPHVFSTFECPGPSRTLGVRIQQLIDVLKVFACSPDAELRLRYPGPNAELLLEQTDDAGDAGRMCTYARVSTEEAGAPRSFEEFFDAASESHFLVPGALLREAMEDLEWVGSEVAVEMDDRAQRVVLSGSHEAGAGSLAVEIPREKMVAFRCATGGVRRSYNYKHLQGALCNTPTFREAPEVSTGVSVDRRGMMKVTHLIGMGAAGGQAINASVVFMVAPLLEEED